MPRVLIYRHPDCARCARIARWHHRLDVLRHIDDTTATPPTGPLRMGEIVVEDRATGRLARGLDAFRLLTRANPLYAPGRLMLAVPALRDRIERDLTGCSGDACDV